ncbi:MAG: HAMP domain-containing protein [Bacteroidetes bacterium]|nr:HAMP domain-containing protein [Bacteroidota bacterium]
MRKKKLFWQLYISSLLVIFLALAAFIFLTSYSFKSILLDQVSDDLLARAAIMRDEVLRSWKDGDMPALQRSCSDISTRSATRVTVIRADGVVLADSWHDPAMMDNHRGRPEIREAMAGKHGNSTRFSRTLQKNTMYAAVTVSDNGRVLGVLRTAVPLETVEASITGLQLQVLLGGLVIALVATLMSLLISRRITRPIETLKQGARRFAEGDLDFRLPVPRSEELSDLAVVMNNMAAQLQERIVQITQQHSEQDAVLSSMVEGVIAFDMEERLINVNHSAARMLRVNIDKAKGKSIQEVVRNIGLQRFVDQTLTSENTTEGYITIVDDVERFLQVHGSILRDEHRKPLGVVVVMNDYTELRNLENVRREFVANVSHELKTPITSIKGFVETLLDGAINDREDAIRFLGIVSRQADRLNAIIEDLLSLSRIEQGGEQEHIELREASVRDVLVSAVQSCQRDADLKQMRIELECAAELQAVTNPPLLEQAVINLISNGIKYSDEGQSIAVHAARSADGMIRIAIKDQGYGIEPEHLPRLFERFYRIDKARSRKLGGTGLGLAIVKHIAQAHHGRVEVQSTPGKGSEFTLIIPAGKSEVDSPDVT